MRRSNHNNASKGATHDFQIDPRDDASSTRLYVMQDANFNLTSICNTFGTVVERYNYLPYGTRTVMNASWTVLSNSAYDWVFGFQGLMHDGETGLIYVRYRWLHAELGRWVQRDPMEYLDSWSLYEFCSSTPPAAIDPTGTQTQPSTQPVSNNTTVVVETDRVAASGQGVGRHTAIIVSCPGQATIRYDLLGEKFDDPNNHNKMKGVSTIKSWDPTTLDYKNKHDIVGDDKAAAYYEVWCSGENCDCDIYNCFAQAMKNANFPAYKRLGPNSNTFAKALLEKCQCMVGPFIQDITNFGNGNVTTQLDIGRPIDAIGWEADYDYWGNWSYAWCPSCKTAPTTQSSGPTTRPSS